MFVNDIHNSPCSHLSDSFANFILADAKMRRKSKALGTWKKEAISMC